MDIETIYSILMAIFKGIGVTIGLAGIWILSIYIRLKLGKQKVVR